MQLRVIAVRNYSVDFKKLFFYVHRHDCEYGANTPDGRKRE